AGIGRRQRELELDGSSHRLRFCRHCLHSVPERTRAMLAHVAGKCEPFNACVVVQILIPKRANEAARRSDGRRPEVKMMRAPPRGVSSVFGPLRSSTRRAIAGAGSMKVTGQGDSCWTRSRRSG